MDFIFKKIRPNGPQIRNLRIEISILPNFRAERSLIAQFSVTSKNQKKGKFSPGQKPIKKSELGGLPAIELFEIASSIIWRNLVFLQFVSKNQMTARCISQYRVLPIASRRSPPKAGTKHPFGHRNYFQLHRPQCSALVTSRVSAQALITRRRAD